MPAPHGPRLRRIERVVPTEPVNTGALDAVFGKVATDLGVLQ